MICMYSSWAGRLGLSHARQHASRAHPRPRRAYLQCKKAQGQCDPAAELPSELQGLYINEEGLLIDEKTGQVINELTGATRFDVAVRALRGEFDPPGHVENTERTPGLLMDSLVVFPAQHTFNLVLRVQGSSVEELLAEMAALVARVTEDAGVAPERCKAKERKGGKYVSLEIPATVRAPEIIHNVFAALEGDQRVLMKY